MAFRRQPRFLYVLSLVLFCVTAILPLAYVFGQFIAGVIERPAALANAIMDSRQLVLLGRSLGIALSATLVALSLGLPVAALLAARDLPLRRLFYFLMLVPVLIPSYVMAGAWIHLLSPAGWVNRTLAALIGQSATLTIQSVPGCAWCLGLSFFPIIALVVAAGLSQLDGNLQDIARLSTGRWGVLWHATLPQIQPHLLASVCLVLIFVLAQYGVPSLLGINTFPVEIFAQYSAFYDETAAVATSLPLTILVVFLILLQQRIMGSRDYVRVTASSEMGAAIALRKLRPYAAIFLTALFLIAVVLPFASVFAYARGLDKVLSTVILFGDSVYLTGLLALCASIAATLLAFSLGHLLAHGQGRLTRMLDVICWLPIAVPGTVMGLGFARIASRFPLLQKFDAFGLLLLLAYIGMFSAFPIRVFHATYRRADPNVDEAATIDCPCWYQKCRHIDMRIHAPAMIVSVMLVFVLVAGELNATVLLVPPGKATLSVSIDNLLHYGASETASAFCLIEAALVLMAAGAGLVALRVAARTFGPGSLVDDGIGDEVPSLRRSVTRG